MILITLAALLLSAFFSGMEIAFLSANKLRLEVERKQSRTYNHISSRFLKAPGQYISTILVGNNIALVIYSLFMSQLYLSVTGSQSYILETLISTLIIIFTAEFLPKAIVKANPNFYLRVFAVPAYLFYILFYPLARFATWLSTLIFKAFGRGIKAGEQYQGGFGKVDLASLVEEAVVNAEEYEDEESDENGHTNNNASDLSVKLFQNALEFSEQKVRDCMIPRTDMEAIDVEKSMDELRSLFVESGYSRIVVYEGTVDHVIGYASIKSLFHNPSNIRDILQETIYVPESMAQQKLLGEFIRTHRSLAVVIDEFGSTAGLVTIEDLLEQIFGEIEDEHDNDDQLVEREIGEGTYVLAGRLEVEYLNEEYELEIPESDRYDTLAGYILNLSEDLPKAGDAIFSDGLKIKILRTSNTKIELVQITKV